MKEFLDAIKSKTPKCLRRYGTAKISQRRFEKWNSGENFVARDIQCGCGCNKFVLECRKVKVVSGLIFKKITFENQSPVFTICTACKAKTLLFDDTIHGWNGESFPSIERAVTQSVEPVFDKPASIVVNCSYQSVDNYEELIESGCKNIEDWFDTFTVYACDENSNATCVVTFECA